MTDENTTDSYTQLEQKFASGQTERELRDLPDLKKDAFQFNLDLICAGLPPELPVKPLDSQGSGVYQLMINGRPAYRCVYYLKVPGEVVVVYAGKKTTNGVDRQLQSTVAERLKAYKAQLKKR